MTRGKKSTCAANGANSNFPSKLVNTSFARNLDRSQLGGVIFGCNNETLRECLVKQLFGLPFQHISYVKNVSRGTSLFLFNYSERKLYGIFEAACSGALNIDRYAWTDNSKFTPYPAQVRVEVKAHCRPQPEDKFKPIIQSNYFKSSHFWFELDHGQTSQLESLFASDIFPSFYLNPINIFAQEISGGGVSDVAEEFSVAMPNIMLNVNDLHEGPSGSIERQIDTSVTDSDYSLIEASKEYVAGNSVNKGSSVEKDNSINSMSPSSASVTDQLVQEVSDLKAINTEQSLKISRLEKKLSDALEQIHCLHNRCSILELDSSLSRPFVDPAKSIYLVGGYDGSAWLATLDLFFPYQDVLSQQRKMRFAHSYGAVTELHNEIYIIGGGDGSFWLDTVESYCPLKDQWLVCPSLSAKKGSLAGVTLNGNIFAIGGGNGVDCFSDVEMLDLEHGQWVPIKPMLHKRFSVAAAELNGALYATGGFNGKEYLTSAERFDPREHSWTDVGSMNTKRGCHCLVVLNQKLYALGGFDGTKMVASTEVFDPRYGGWVISEPMTNPRGYSAAVVIDNTAIVIGGSKSLEDIVESIEYFKEGRGWCEKPSSAIGKRCFLSAVVM